jgi:hypothetical protein
MYKFRLHISVQIFFSILLLSSKFLFPQVPGTISYQGVLSDNSGNPINKNVEMKFALFPDSTSTKSLWSEDQQNVNITNGIFNVLLGSVTSLPDTLGFNAPYWLQVTISGSNISLPRVQLTSSPYSFNTSRIQGKKVSSSSPSIGQVLKWTGTQWAPGADETIGGSASGDISGTYPNLTVTGLQDKPVSSTSPSSGQVLKWNGNSWAPDTDETGGLTLPFSKTTSNSGNVFNINTSASATVIRGATTSESGTSYGVYGLSSSTSGTGVYGNANNLSGNNYGVYGTSSSSSGVGVEGNAISNAANSSGVIGTHISGNYGRIGTQEAGVIGLGKGTSYGILGIGDNSGYAGYFLGNVHVEGTLSKSSGSFEIDDPLDPANKILRHSFVESPDMMNIYNGNVTTNATGVAVIQLPDYFTALNENFKYQLTAIGQFAQAIVSQEIQNNQFTIKTDKPNVKVSWQVTGIRKDPWAQKNRIVVEQEKSSQERGYYLNPKAYGLSEAKSIEYATHPEMMKQLQKVSEHIDAGKER